MTVLVACLGLDPNARKHVLRLIEEQEWERVILVASKASRNDFPTTKEVQWVVADPSLYLKQLKDTIKRDLSGCIGFGDVAVNLVSGTGKEHMALLGALLALGAGIRLVALTPEGISEI